MKIKKTLFAVAALCVCMASCPVNNAVAVTPAQKLKHADKNKDGMVDPYEMKKERQWAEGQRVKVNTWWEKKADVNKDGYVEKSEYDDMRRRRMSWILAQETVDTPQEAKFDTNKDGWIDPKEARALLRAKYEVATTKGKAVVDTMIEKAYDTNNDNVIDAKEAEALLEDLSE